MAAPELIEHHYVRLLGGEAHGRNILPHHLRESAYQGYVATTYTVSVLIIPQELRLIVWYELLDLLIRLNPLCKNFVCRHGNDIYTFEE